MSLIGSLAGVKAHPFGWVAGVLVASAQRAQVTIRTSTRRRVFEDEVGDHSQVAKRELAHLGVWIPFVERQPAPRDDFQDGEGLGQGDERRLR